jgi:hypothetical protein
MLRNESAQNLTKPKPSRPSRLPDSGGIIFFSNGVFMEKISHSVRQAKQAKFLDADCTCPYSPYRTRVSPYRTRVSPYKTHGSTKRRHVVGPYDDMLQVPYRTCGGSRE